MNTLLDLFDSFENLGDKTAFVNRTGVRRLVVSYRQFHLLCLKMARLLADRGVGEGDRVLLWGPNSSWWGVAYWGIIIRGAVAVPVDFMSERERAQTIHGLTEAVLAIQSRYKPDRIEAPALLLEELPFLLEDLKPIENKSKPSSGDIAQLIYTSGTTGNPKGVMLTHANLVANMTQIHNAVPIITSEFTFLSLLPLSHMFEQMGGFFLPLSRGAAIVYLRTLKPSAIMEALGEEDISVIMSVPRLMQLLKTSVEQGLEEKHLGKVARLLLGQAENFPPEMRRMLFWPIHHKFGRHFAVFVSGGAPLDPEVFKFWHGMGFTLLEGYGLTETSPVLAVNPIEQQRNGSVGLALPGVELQVRDKEILARGANVFPGYYQNEQATRDAFTEDGWFRSGDLGEIDQDGWVTIKGREKELIVTGAGINVYPEEIEAVLNKVPGVRESCVIGMDRGGGEEVHAVLLLNSGATNPDEIIAAANASLDTLHRITGHTVWQEPEFPKTTTLKVKKFQVKEQIRKGRGEGVGPSSDRLYNLLARVIGADLGEIHEESLLVADLGLTSIARVELVNYLEQEFRLDIGDSQLGPETRVRDIRQIIEKREKQTSRDHFRFWSNSTPVRGIRQLWDALVNRPLYRSFVTLEVRGAEHVQDLQGPVIFIGNHSSYFDQPSVMFSLPRRIRYRTASAAYEEFFFGRFDSFGQRLWRRFAYEYGTWLLNLFPLPQTRGFSGALRYMGKLADNGISILIFPEGQHTRDGSMHDFQSGLGIMVKELGLPVVPFKIRGTRDVLPHGAAWPKRGTVSVTFGSPIDFQRSEPAEIVERSRKAVEEL